MTSLIIEWKLCHISALCISLLHPERGCVSSMLRVIHMVYTKQPSHLFKAPTTLQSLLRTPCGAQRVCEEERFPPHSVGGVQHLIALVYVGDMQCLRWLQQLMIYFQVSATVIESSMQDLLTRVNSSWMHCLFLMLKLKVIALTDQKKKRLQTQMISFDRPVNYPCQCKCHQTLPLSVFSSTSSKLFSALEYPHHPFLATDLHL